MTSRTDDLVEIRALYERYSHGIDIGDGQMFASCFTDDGSLDTMGEPMVGHTAIAGFCESTHEMLPWLRHQATNIVIDLDGGVDGDGDSATAAAFMIAFNVENGFDFVISGRYTDEFRRTDDGWRISSRIFTADQTS